MLISDGKWVRLLPEQEHLMMKYKQFKGLDGARRSLVEKQFQFYHLDPGGHELTDNSLENRLQWVQSAVNWPAMTAHCTSNADLATHFKGATAALNWWEAIVAVLQDIVEEPTEHTVIPAPPEPDAASPEPKKKKRDTPLDKLFNHVRERWPILPVSESASDCTFMAWNHPHRDRVISAPIAASDADMCVIRILQTHGCPVLKTGSELWSKATKSRKTSSSSQPLEKATGYLSNKVINFANKSRGTIRALSALMKHSAEKLSVPRQNVLSSSNSMGDADRHALLMYIIDNWPTAAPDPQLIEQLIKVGFDSAVEADLYSVLTHFFCFCGQLPIFESTKSTRICIPQSLWKSTKKALAEIDFPAYQFMTGQYLKTPDIKAKRGIELQKFYETFLKLKPMDWPLVYVNEIFPQINGSQITKDEQGGIPRPVVEQVVVDILVNYERYSKDCPGFKQGVENLQFIPIRQSDHSTARYYFAAHECYSDKSELFRYCYDRALMVRVPVVTLCADPRWKQLVKQACDRQAGSATGIDPSSFVSQTNSWQAFMSSIGLKFGTSDEIEALSSLLKDPICLLNLRPMDKRQFLACIITGCKDAETVQLQRSVAKMLKQLPIFETVSQDVFVPAACGGQVIDELVLKLHFSLTDFVF
jgi:hypothetical protein